MLKAKKSTAETSGLNLSSADYQAYCQGKMIKAYQARMRVFTKTKSLCTKSSESTAKIAHMLSRRIPKTGERCISITHRSLQRGIGRTEATVRRALKEGEQQGLWVVERIRFYRKPSVFRITASERFFLLCGTKKMMRLKPPSNDEKII